MLFIGTMHTGYYSLCAAIRKAIENGLPLLDPAFCCKLTLADVQGIFKSATSTEIPLLEKRLEVFHEFGSVLSAKFDGSFATCVKKANKDAVALVKIITDNFPCFQDYAVFQGSNVSFLKRAQIADIYGCFNSKSWGEFDNIEGLTKFADYRVPLRRALNMKKLVSKK